MSIIKYATDECVVLNINEGLYYLKCCSIPRVYDNELNIIDIRSVNYWLESNTGHSYKQILLLADAFKDGLDKAYCLRDIKLLSEVMIKAAEEAIFKTDLIHEYASIYWIELMDINKIGKFISLLRNNFDDMLKKYGKESLYNMLCRLWQFCNICYPDEMHVFESMIKNKLMMTPKLPSYPDTTELNVTMREMIFGIVFGGEYGEYKNVSNEIVKNAEKIVNKDD